VGYALAYFRDFVKPAKVYRAPDEAERRALEDLVAALRALPAQPSPELAQDAVYDVGRRPPYTTEMKDGRQGVSLAWFNTLYEILLGETQGPRFGSFVALFGRDETVALIEKALSGALMAEHKAFLASRGKAAG
jgi:lysyl-tRNA synthetase class 1